jgi:ABC-type uncharacterized transport system substrate-binding protein
VVAGLARIYAAQLIGLLPDVILASSTTNLRIIQEATSTVPVVFIAVLLTEESRFPNQKQGDSPKKQGKEIEDKRAISER